MALSSNVVFYLKFDESSGTATDSSGNGRDFTNNNGRPYTTGILNNCCGDQTGSSYNFTRANESALSPTAAATWSCWFYPLGVSGSENTNICSKWYYFSTGSWLLRTNGTEIEFYVDGSNSAITSGAGLSANTWYHVVVVFDGAGSGNTGRLKIYLNGVLQTLTYSGTIPSALNTSSAPFQIAAWHQTGVIERGFRGYVDEFGFMNAAWSAAYVTAAYGGGTPPSYSEWSSLGAASVFPWYYFAQQEAVS